MEIANRHSSPTPLLDSLVKARDSYGLYNAKRVFYEMKGRLQRGRTQQVLTLVGGTRAGKTTLLGEIAENLAKSGYKGVIVTFESALKAAKVLEEEYQLGKMDIRHESGQYSQAEYQFASRLMEKAVRLAMDDDAVQFVLMETPATTGFHVNDIYGQPVILGKDRGTSTVRSVARREGFMKDVEYDDSYINPAANKERRLAGYETRLDIARHSKSPREVLQGNGVSFQGKGSLALMGGSAEATIKVDIDESMTLLQLSRLGYIQLPFSHLVNPCWAGQKDLDIMLSIKTKSWAPWFFGSYLSVNPSRVANAINAASQHVKLYNTRISQEDYIQKMLKGRHRRRLIPD